MSLVDIDQLTLREKFQVMESIWADLRAKVDQMDVPQRHRELLKQRREDVESGRSQLLSWDEVKTQIGRKRA